MEQELWQQCLQLISESVSAHTFDVWFKDITIESYDPDKHTVLIVVPHRFVYEYLEEVQAALLKKALDTAFAADVRLNYRIRKEPTAAPAIEFPALPQRPHVTIPNARERLENGLKHFMGDKARWLPCYDEVAEWLTDNKGRGLLCFGTSGLGKSTICRDILPVLLGKSNVVSVTAIEMGQRIDELLKARCIIIDGLGKEAVQETVNFRRRTPFYELCDAAVSGGLLLIITTNLATTNVPDNPLYSDSIEHRYGPDVLSRLRAATKAVIFKGKDMWK
jgi:DNA replication protein DnaC